MARLWARSNSAILGYLGLLPQTAAALFKNSMMIESIYIFGTRVSLYYLCWFFGVVTVLVAGYVLGHKMHIEPSRRILYTVFALISGVVFIKLTSRIYGGGEYFARMVPLLPAPFLLIALAFRETYGKVTDFLSPLVPMVHAGAHIGCIFVGCCHGYPSDWGLYSNAAGTVCFPNVPIEIITLYALSAMMAVMVCKGKQQGRLYAWYMVLFGITRFFLEFLRDNEKIWCGLSELSFQALASLVLGLVMLAISKWICKRSPHYEES